MFKRITLAAILALAAVFMASTVYATGPPFELKELSLKLTIPEGWFTVTRDTPAADPIFADIGSDGNAFLNYMVQRSIYLDAVNLSPFSEIVVTKVENSDINKLYNLSLISDSQREDFARQLLNSQSAKDAGIAYAGYSMYSHAQAKFVVLDLTQTASGVTAYGRQYMTVINGAMISITMHSYGAAITDAQQTLLKTIVDGASFTRVSSRPLNFGVIISTAILYAAVAAVLAGALAGVALMRRNRKKRLEAAAYKAEEEKNETGQSEESKGRL